MNTYLAFKHPHLLMAALMAVTWVAAAVMVSRGSSRAIPTWLKVAPHALALLLIITGGGMVHAYGGLPGWVIAKFVLLVVLVLSISRALKTADKRPQAMRWLVLGLLTYVYIVGVAMARDVLGWLA